MRGKATRSQGHAGGPSGKARRMGGGGVWLSPPPRVSPKSVEQRGHGWEHLDGSGEQRGLEGGMGGGGALVWPHVGMGTSPDPLGDAGGGGVSRAGAGLVLRCRMRPRSRLHPSTHGGGVGGTHWARPAPWFLAAGTERSRSNPGGGGGVSPFPDGGKSQGDPTRDPPHLFLPPPPRREIGQKRPGGTRGHCSQYINPP